MNFKFCSNTEDKLSTYETQNIQPFPKMHKEGKKRRNNKCEIARGERKKCVPPPMKDYILLSLGNHRIYQPLEQGVI